MIVRLAADEGNYAEELASVSADPQGGLDALVSIPQTAPTSGEALLEALGLRGDAQGEPVAARYAQGGQRIRARARQP